MAPPRARRSTTTIALPMPFIFTKDWLASAPTLLPAHSAIAGPCPRFARFIWRINADWPVAYDIMHEMPRIIGFAAQRRRTIMLCPRLVAPLLLAMTLALAGPPALAQHAPAGLSAPSPLQPGDAFGENVTLPERTIVYLKGTSKWDGAFDTLIDAFKSLNEYLDKAGIKPTGSAMTIYLSLIHISEPTRQAEISYAVF